MCESIAFLILFSQLGFHVLTRENLTLLFANNIGTDQPVHSHSLISTFIKFAGKHNSQSCYMRNLKIPASLCSWAGWFEPYLVANPEGRLSRVETQFIFENNKTVQIQKELSDHGQHTVCLDWSLFTLYSMIKPFDAFEISCFWKYYGKWSICSFGANSLFSIIFSKVLKTYFKFLFEFFNVV